MTWRWWARCLAVPGVLLAGCGDGEEPGASVVVDSAPAPAVAESTVAVADTATVGCPDWGLWRECSVQYRLERAGLRVERRPEPVRHAWLSIDGIVLDASRAEVQVFLYPSEADRVRDFANVDTAGVHPLGQRIIWPQPATLVTSLNLAAIVISLNERQTERIALALGAGLPQR